MSLDTNLTIWEQDKPERVNSERTIVPLDIVRKEIGISRAEVVDTFRKLVMDRKYADARKLYEEAKKDDQSIGDLNYYCSIHKKILAVSKL